MDQARWKRIEEIFESLLDYPPQSRPKALKGMCGGDEELEKEILLLLKEDARENSMIDGMAIDYVDLPGVVGQGHVIDSFRVERKIGEGGMSNVYMAQELTGKKRKIALKLLRPGLNTQSILRRFQREHEILARLRHPNIARLIKVGVSEDDQPYIAMEYIEGEPLDTYCDKRSLTIEERIELFQVVCRAVQHAHINKVVHRDLKPANILVEADGTVKLLDFGISKLIDTADEHTKITKTGVHVMTPQYAAPEQVRSLEITVATDIYALGVILYELVAGNPPLALDGLGIFDVQRKICTEEPQLPSEALTRPDYLGESHEARIASQRGTNIAALRKMLQGAMDTICQRALAKSPEDRYKMVEYLMYDLKRYVIGLGMGTSW